MQTIPSMWEFSIMQTVSGSIPTAGSIIFFDWDHDGVSDHVGIVESCDGTTVYTPEMRLRRIVIRFIQHLLWDMELFQGCESLYRRGKSI